MPYSQSLSPGVTIGARTANDPGAMSKTIAAAVHSVDPQIALGRIRTMDQVKDESLAEDRFTVVLFASFAAAALLLAAIGIYGLMAFAVSQRTPEIGLRLALGSGREPVIWLVLREASVLALFGLAIGFVGAVLVGRAMRTTLYGVGSLDLSVIVLVAAHPVPHRVAGLVRARPPRRRHRSHAGPANRITCRSIFEEARRLAPTQALFRLRAASVLTSSAACLTRIDVRTPCLRCLPSVEFLICSSRREFLLPPAAWHV